MMQKVGTQTLTSIQLYMDYKNSEQVFIVNENLLQCYFSVSEALGRLAGQKIRSRACLEQFKFIWNLDAGILRTKLSQWVLMRTMRTIHTRYC